MWVRWLRKMWGDEEGEAGKKAGLMEVLHREVGKS